MSTTLSSAVGCRCSPIAAARAFATRMDEPAETESSYASTAAGEYRTQPTMDETQPTMDDRQVKSDQVEAW
jgi:hypothetical protein